MGRKDREITISGLTASSDLDALTAVFARFGACKKAFFLQGSTSQAIVCFEQEESVEPALRGTRGMNFEGRRLNTYQAKGKNKSGGFSNPNNASAAASWAGTTSTNPDEPERLAPGPRLISAEEAARHGIEIASLGLANGNAEASGSGSNAAVDAVVRQLDSWELSLLDPDFDDGWRPSKAKKVEVIKRDEFEEAYDLVRSFAHLGGAIMAVDVESWDQNHDYIIEVGLAKVEYEPKNGTAPWCKSEHLIVSEHDHRRNGIYSPDAKNKFAFGTSKKLTEHEVAVRLRFYMKALSQEQPLILLFHNAEAEKTYFEQMNIEVKDFVERVPMTVLNDIRNGRARRGEARSHIIILDTQRLYKSFTYETPDAYEQPQIALGKLAKKLGITPKYLHNAGNDAQYTLEVFMAMLAQENAIRQQARLAARL